VWLSGTSNQTAQGSGMFRRVWQFCDNLPEREELTLVACLYGVIKNGLDEILKIWIMGTRFSMSLAALMTMLAIWSLMARDSVRAFAHTAARRAVENMRIGNHFKTEGPTGIQRQPRPIRQPVEVPLLGVPPWRTQSQTKDICEGWKGRDRLRLLMRKG